VSSILVQVTFRQKLRTQKAAAAHYNALTGAVAAHAVVPLLYPNSQAALSAVLPPLQPWTLEIVERRLPSKAREICWSQCNSQQA